MKVSDNVYFSLLGVTKYFTENLTIYTQVIILGFYFVIEMIDYLIYRQRRKIAVFFKLQ